MKMLYSIGLACLFLFAITGCASSIYGVPQDEWNRMSETQRQIAIQGYNEREKLREQTRLKEAEKEAKEAEIKAIEAKRQEQLRKERVDAIYSGEAGQYGDLIRVSISGGDMTINGRQKSYQPISFKVANGEVRKYDIVSSDSRGSESKDDMLISYQDGTLFIDAEDSYYNKPLRIIYEQGWKTGKTYTVNSESRLKLRNVQVYVEIIPHLKENKHRR